MAKFFERENIDTNFMNEKVQQIKNDPTDFGGTGNYPRSPGVKNKRLEIIFFIFQ